jgi:hypothetical protein
MSGLTVLSKQTALASILPGGTDVYVGLFTELPTDDAPTGGVEATGSGYARVVHSTWTNTTVNDDVYRVNNGAVEFAALSADLTGINGWGIWDASSSGNLLAYGPILDVSDNEVSDKTFTSGNQPRFVGGELKVGLT